jgi:hypothetical protein
MATNYSTISATAHSIFVGGKARIERNEKRLKVVGSGRT